ncbi:hypothetical protein H2201_003336 [Coniosporium apollinis]|uniref:Cytochrome P450 oxidoreductase n=2 Tax=Coniosporium TaxID=2810619 RepID=A0ABQ9NVJ6_9PEZI|nr:hypothetical protein H2199_002225 [Cladosporium sp. JES 115]KAJ9666414.1 hypothetical protein H2201_003336 [Coniosporium apollinis]
MHMQLVFLSALGLLFIRLLLYFYHLTTSPLKDIPGPFLARFTKWWYFYRVFRGHFERDNISLHRRLGPIVRIAPDHYSINDPSAIKTIYGIGSNFPKSDWYEGWKHPSPDRWTLFPERNMKRHAETRKRFQSMYSMTSLVSYEPYVDDCADLFETRLREFAQAERELDIAHWFQCYAFDVIGHITFGERFGFLDRGEDINGALAALQNTMVYSTLIGIFAKWHPILFGPMSRFKWSGAAGRAFIMKFVQGIISRRKAKEPEEGEISRDVSGPQDFLGKMMQAHRENPEKVTDYHIFMMGQSNIIAGSDTTSISLSSILYYLVHNPETMRKLRDEIAQFDAEGRCDIKTTFKQSQEMPYLQAVIKEALRMHSATGLPLWRVVPDGGSEISGRFFPAGTVVGVNTWVAHYNDDVFADAMKFQPERWLDAQRDPKNLKDMEAYYMPFGLGSRTCLGKHISILEMSKLIPRVVRLFEFQPVERGWDTLNYWFVKPTSFKLRVRLRGTDGKTVSSDWI